MIHKQAYKIFTNKIIFDWALGSSSTKQALSLAQKYNLPVIIKYTKNNVAITPGDGLLANNFWYTARLCVLGNYEKIK